MDKPVSVMIEDAKRDIIACVNRQNINPSIMRYILKEVLDMVVQAGLMEYEKDREAFEKKDTVMEEQG